MTTENASLRDVPKKNGGCSCALFQPQIEVSESLKATAKLPQKLPKNIPAAYEAFPVSSEALLAPGSSQLSIIMETASDM